MRAHTYQKLALRTNVRTNQTEQLLHSALGVAGEISEIITSSDDGNSIEEIGDTLWYIAIGCDAIGLDMEDLEQHKPEDEILQAIQIQSGLLCDVIKRAIFYKDEINSEAAEECFAKLFSYLEDYAINDIGVSIEECMDKNIRKLEIRYPDSFSDERALKRDTKEEQEVFKD